MSPQSLGSRYLLDEPIGEGGMGVVWRGRDRETGAQYAIKVLRPEFAADPNAVARFVRERTALVTFRHQNVVAVHDTVIEGNRLALVMDLIHGGDLHAYRKRRGGKLAPDEAASLTAQICDGLAAAHAVGIVHRDLKPANILIEGGHVWLADFGIARVLGQPTSTTTGTIMGTVHYMAPEAIAGQDSSAASDVYAVGITLYELLAGELPFTGHAAAIMHGHMTTMPSRPAGVPDWLWDVISGCVTKKPDDRPTAAAAARSLWAGLPAAVRAARPVRPQPRAVTPPPPLGSQAGERTSAHSGPPGSTAGLVSIGAADFGPSSMGPSSMGPSNIGPASAGPAGAGVPPASPPGDDLPGRGQSPRGNRRLIVALVAAAGCVAIALVLTFLDPFKSAGQNNVVPGSLGVLATTAPATRPAGQATPQPGRSGATASPGPSPAQSPSPSADPTTTASPSLSPSHSAKPTTSPKASVSPTSPASSSPSASSSPPASERACTPFADAGVSGLMQACITTSALTIQLSGTMGEVPALASGKEPYAFEIILIGAKGIIAYYPELCAPGTCLLSKTEPETPGTYQIRMNYLVNGVVKVRSQLSAPVTIGSLLVRAQQVVLIKHSWQAETAHYRGVHEAGYRAYPVAAQGQHGQAVRAVHVAVGQVHAEGRLPVRPGRHEHEPLPGPPPGADPQELGDRGPALVLQLARRHGVPRVIRQQRHHARHVVAGVRGGEPLGEVAFDGGAGERGRVRGQAGHRSAGALQRTVHRHF
jgi:serine/threonine-protein kinase